MKKVCIVLATVLVAMAVAVVAAISLMFWAIMLALVSWSVVFLTGALHNLFSTPALSFWQSVGVLLALLCLIIPLREGRSAEGEDRQQ